MQIQQSKKPKNQFADSLHFKKNNYVTTKIALSYCLFTQLYIFIF